MPSVVLAIAAALVFAAANNLQRGAASAVPLADGGPVRLVLRLLRTPRWLLGSSLAVLALAVHATALRHGSVIVVQSVLAAGLVFALGIEAARERRLIRPGELAGSALLVLGVVLVLDVGRPGGGRDVGLREQLLTAVTLAGVAAVGLLGVRMHGRVRTSALVMGGAAGACFALDAVFLKGVATHVGTLDAVPAVIDLAGFAGASAVGNLVVQRAYQVAPLRFVLPAVTAGDPLAAFVVGRLLLHEQLQGGAPAHAAVIAGLALMALGITVTTAVGTPPDGPARVREAATPVPEAPTPPGEAATPTATAPSATAPSPTAGVSPAPGRREPARPPRTRRPALGMEAGPE